MPLLAHRHATGCLRHCHRPYCDCHCPTCLQAALDMLSGKLATVHLNGFVFFGSANSIGQKLQEVSALPSGGLAVGLQWEAALTERGSCGAT